MKFSILTIGDEICIGQVVNTNQSWLASQLTALGYSAYKHLTVPDEKNAIKNEIKQLYHNSNLLIMTGGLGPTHDDITKSVLNDFLEDELVYDSQIKNYLIDLYSKRGRNITNYLIDQALVPSKCKALSNTSGTVPGILYEKDEKMILALPGVPEEVKNIFNNQFISIAQKHFEKYSSEVQLFLTINTHGAFESQLEELIGKPENFPSNCTLAYLPASGKVRLRIGAKGKDYKATEASLNLMKEFVETRILKYIVGYTNESLNELIARLLRQKKITIATAESCTGGMLSSVLTELPGSSEYYIGSIISYSNDIKINQLNVKKETILEFGAVSMQTALEMAENIRLKFQSDLGISITGIAGPDGGTQDKPVGTVWIGISDKHTTKASVYNFGNDRKLNRERAVEKSLDLIKERIIKL